MISTKKMTAKDVEDIDERAGINYIKEGTLLEAQGKFSMEYFEDY